MKSKFLYEQKGNKATCLEPIALTPLLEIRLKSLFHLLLVLRRLARADEEGKQAGKKVKRSQNIIIWKFCKREIFDSIPHMGRFIT